MCFNWWIRVLLLNCDDFYAIILMFCISEFHTLGFAAIQDAHLFIWQLGQVPWTVFENYLLGVQIDFRETRQGEPSVYMNFPGQCAFSV